MPTISDWAGNTIKNIFYHLYNNAMAQARKVNEDGDAYADDGTGLDADGEPHIPEIYENGYVILKGDSEENGQLCFVHNQGPNAANQFLGNLQVIPLAANEAAVNKGDIICKAEPEMLQRQPTNGDGAYLRQQYARWKIMGLKYMELLRSLFSELEFASLTNEWKSWIEAQSFFIDTKDGITLFYWIAQVRIKSGHVQIESIIRSTLAFPTSLRPSDKRELADVCTEYMIKQRELQTHKQPLPDRLIAMGLTDVLGYFFFFS